MTQPWAVGIDIGGTNTSYGIVGRDGHVVARGSMHTRAHDQFDDYINALKTNVEALVEQAGVGLVDGIGVGAPNGNVHTGEIYFAPNLPWKGVLPLGRALAELTRLPVKVTNDAKAAAMGEMLHGAAWGMSDFIMVTLGTGLGSGFVANGALVYGHDGFAGELGHVTVVPDGRLCGCGRKGCLETYASATGLVRTATEWLQHRADPSALRHEAEPLTAARIQHAAERGDQLALEMYQFTGKILGQALAQAVAITSPQAIIFFGGVAHAGPILLEPVRRNMEESLLPIFRNKVNLLLSHLPGADAAVIGAASLIWHA
jgi:glucokinase